MITRLIILICLIHSQCPAATIKGTVKDSETGEILNHATVALSATKFGSSVDNVGMYKIDSVQPGVYVLVVHALAYVSVFDTVRVMSNDDVVIREISLQKPKVESTPELERYHARLQQLRMANRLVSIRIDSVKFENNFVTVFPSFSNTSDLPVYVLRCHQCINPIEPIVKSSRRKPVQQNAIRIDCVGEKIFPDSSDLIELKPHSSISYPPVTLELYDFSRYAPDVYSISIKYVYKKPDYLCCYGFRNDYREQYRDNIKVMTTALRGEFVSVNSKKVSNHKSANKNH